MIVIDTSAIVAILTDEDDAHKYFDAMLDNEPVLLSAASLVEAGIVMNRRHVSGGIDRVKNLVREANIDVVDVTVEHAHLALSAFQEFGKGTGAKAQLNFGDCFSYALAKATHSRLLFKGEDFQHTDLETVLG